MKRRVWLLYPDHVGQALLGPGVRILAIANLLAEAGHEVHLALGEGSSPLRPSGEIHLLERSILRKIAPGDAVLVSGYLPGRILGDLIASNIPFHADYYCLTAPEILQFPPSNWVREFRQRRSRILRYLVTLQRAERTYVSNKLQTAFLGGGFFPSFAPGTNAFIDSLPQRIVEFPMGVSETPFPEIVDNPYPATLQGRPILLWGGGIWSWFDVSTLLQAMKILADQGSNAALFFLGGKTLTGRVEHERPIQEALALSERLGLLDRSVFFNERRASVSELPGFLFHSVAGVMANPPSFESLASWRTRYLDLLWAGKPLIASGSDPLGLRMADSGAARLVEAGNPAAFADAMACLIANRDSQMSMGAASRRLGQTMSWSNVARPLLQAVADPAAFRTIPQKPSPTWMIRYRLGV